MDPRKSYLRQMDTVISATKRPVTIKLEYPTDTFIFLAGQSCPLLHGNEWIEVEWGVPAQAEMYVWP
jgi:hypothetical protein